MNLLTLTFLLIGLCSSECYRILGLFPYPARSHYACFDQLLVELAKRGHNVTVYNMFPKPYKIANYEEIDISFCFSLPDILSINKMHSLSSGSYAFTKLLFRFMPSRKEIQECEPLLRLLNGSENFDVLITEAFNTDFFMLFARRFRVPLIAFHSNTPLPWLAYRMGLPDNPSYMPYRYTEYLRDMNFFQRVENTLLRVWAFVSYTWYSEWYYDKIAYEYYGSSIWQPLAEVIRNTSLLFLYAHFSIHPVRPLVPNVVEVLGLHIKEPKIIPQVCDFEYLWVKMKDLELAMVKSVSSY